MKAVTVLILLAFVLGISATSAQACQRTVSKVSASTIVPKDRIDQRLLDQAIRAEVNFHRCRAGLGPLGHGGANLSKIATTHSVWMAKKKKLSHRNSIKGLESLAERIRAAGVGRWGGAENIVMVHRYQIDNKRFKTLDRRQCQFAAGGKMIAQHSYASLARHAVDLWMKSPGHRQNILSTKWNRMVVAIAYAPSRRYCGEYWLTQNFVG